MDQSTVAAILFAVAAVFAAIHAFRQDIFEKVHKLALACSFAFVAFLVEVQHVLGK
jgi:hypothetical protein